MISSIRNCKYFIGVDSGPLYLASSILGSNSCIGMEYEFKIGWYNSSINNIIDTKNYEEGTISNIIKKLDN